MSTGLWTDKRSAAKNLKKKANIQTFLKTLQTAKANDTKILKY